MHGHTILKNKFHSQETRYNHSQYKHHKPVKIKQAFIQANEINNLVTEFSQ